MNAILVIAAVLLAGLMATAIWLDAMQRRLPNSLVLATLAAGIAVVLASQGWQALGSSALHSALALAVAIAFYAIGWIGAGDAKFYAAVAIWFPLSQALSLLVMISALGLLIVLGWLFALRVRRRARGEKGANGKFPLGVPIAIGAFAQFASQLFTPLT